MIGRSAGGKSLTNGTARPSPPCPTKKRGREIGKPRRIKVQDSERGEGRRMGTGADCPNKFLTAGFLTA